MKKSETHDVIHRPSVEVVSQTSLEIILAKPDAPRTWDPLPGYTDAPDWLRDDFLRAQQAETLDKENRDALSSVMYRGAFGLQTPMELLADAYFTTEFRQSGRTWEAICAKYQIRRREPVALPRSAAEAERLRREAEEAIARADTAQAKVEAEQRALGLADQAEKAAEGALIQARGIHGNQQQRLAQAKEFARRSWTNGDWQNQPNYYANVQVFERIVADFPEVEKQLAADLEAASANHRQLRESIAA